METPNENKKEPIWKRVRIGVPKYDNPDELWADAVRYFEWCDGTPVDAPIQTTRYKKEKHGGSKEMKKQDQQENITRPYTIYGLCAFTGIKQWSGFKATYLSKEGFDEVIYAIENVISSQQIDNAMAGVFKENLTARLNGLADKQLQETNAEIEVNAKFNGFSFLPYTAGLPNSEQSKIASGQIELQPEEKKKEPLFAEIVDYEVVKKNETAMPTM